MRKSLNRKVVIVAVLVGIALCQAAWGAPATDQADRDARDRAANPGIERVEPVGFAAAAPASSTPEQEALVAKLKAARHAGDQARAERILALLSPPAEPTAPAAMSVPLVDVGAGLPGGIGSRYGSDVLVADQSYIEGHPDMVSTDSGKFFVAIESMDSDSVWIYGSANGGETWAYYMGITGSGGNDILDPAIAVPEYTEDYLYLVYEYIDNIQLMRIKLSDKTYTFYNIETNVLGVGRPRIVTDNHDFSGYYVHVAYVSGTLLKAGDAYEVWSARSTDKGATWTKHSHYVPDFYDPMSRPDIAYGGDNLYVTWDEEVIGSSTELDVYVSRSTDWGATWSAKVNLCSSTGYDCFDPRVAAIQDGDEAVVAYTKDYTTDTDVWYGSSTDGGATWTLNHALASGVDVDEERPDLCVSESLGDFHVVYWDEWDIVYEHAPYTSIVFTGDEIVNDTNYASRNYQPATVAVHFPTGEAGAAWSDYLDADYNILFDRADWFVATDPAPEVKVNGGDGPLNLAHGSPLNVTLSLDPGDGGNADWWILVNSPFGWYRYNALTGGWVAGFAPAHQGALYAINSMSVFNGSGLPRGNYTFYFGVDMVMDGNLDMGAAFYDFAQVHIY